MGRALRVSNLTNGCWLKLKQAAQAVEVCSAVWVIPGVSIRNVTLAEAIALRNLQAAQRAPLPYAELPGLTFMPAAGAKAAEGLLREQRLARQADAFAQSNGSDTKNPAVRESV